jgi:predicted CXXCH cytochrome family protein
MPQEMDPDNGYLGAAGCAKCHQAEFDQWQTTGHAKALDTLVGKQQDTIERCLGCHTTGFGYDRGFATAEETPELANVQCETCHGPGKKHAASPTNARLVRDRPQKPICQQCHNQTAVPSITNFDQVYNEYRAKVVHKPAR